MIFFLYVNHYFSISKDSEKMPDKSKNMIIFETYSTIIMFSLYNKYGKFALFYKIVMYIAAR